MGRSKASPATFRRPLVALVCMFGLLLNGFALGHMRGVVATKHVQTAMIAAASGQPTPLTAQSGTICPFAVFSTSAVAEQSALLPPAAAQNISFAFANEAAPSSHTYSTPFRPPRAA